MDITQFLRILMVEAVWWVLQVTSDYNWNQMYKNPMFWQNGGFDGFDGLVDMDSGLREMYKNPALLTT